MDQCKLPWQLGAQTKRLFEVEAKVWCGSIATLQQRFIQSHKKSAALQSEEFRMGICIAPDYHRESKSSMSSHEVWRLSTYSEFFSAKTSWALNSIMSNRTWFKLYIYICVCVCVCMYAYIIIWYIHIQYFIHLFIYLSIYLLIYSFILLYCLSIYVHIYIYTSVSNIPAIPIILSYERIVYLLHLLPQSKGWTLQARCLSWRFWKREFFKATQLSYLETQFTKPSSKLA